MSDLESREVGGDETPPSGDRGRRAGGQASPPDDSRGEAAFTPLQPGIVLNNTHRIEHLVARGGMGQVYRAINLLTGDAVAVKVIRADLVNDPQIRALFLREAKALRRIRHPAIVSYEGVHADAGGRVYLVMDFIEGPSLAKHAAERPLTVTQVDALRRRLAQGLGAAHERNIVHRDLSPDNIVLPGGDLDRATIIDFGIAKTTNGGASSIIGSGFAGKIEYASPEQMGLFGRTVDQRSDVYSLGLVLAAAALGRPLGMGETPAHAVAARQRLPDLSALPAPLQPGLAAMLQPDPKRRVPSMRDVLALSDALPSSRRRDGRARGKWMAIAVAVFVAAAMTVVIAQQEWLLEGIVRMAGLLGSSQEETAPAGSGSGRRTEEEQRAEDLAWAAARTANTMPALRSYLEKYPAGRYTAEARDMMALIERRDRPPSPRDCTQCPEMVSIPPGSFRMGSPPDEAGRDDSESPQHQVTITYPFSLGKYEVTRGEFAAFVQATGHQMAGDWRNPGFRQTGRDPVVNVSWDDAKAYVAWLSQTTAKAYRLPSEAEWEYAARAGTTTARYWGDRHQDACQYANVDDASHGCADGHARTAPVGKFRPNHFGLYDVLGNVWEWIEDCGLGFSWSHTYAGAPADGTSWQHGGCFLPGMRGGSWADNPGAVRAARRMRGAGTKDGWGLWVSALLGATSSYDFALFPL